MTLDEVARLVAAADGRGVGEIAVTLGGCTLTLRAGVAPVALQVGAVQAGAVQAGTVQAGPVAVVSAPVAATLRAPCAGVFRIGHPANPAAPAGERAVVAGEVVGFLQIGPCLRPVLSTARAGTAGRIGPALVADGALVGYGTPLFPVLESLA